MDSSNVVLDVARRIDKVAFLDSVYYPMGCLTHFFLSLLFTNQELWPMK